MLVARMGHKNYGIYALILFYSFPITYLVTGNLFVENFWTAFLLGALLVLLGQRETDPLPRPGLAGAFAGFALATKVTAVGMFPWLVVILSWRLFKNKIGVRQIVISVLIAIGVTLIVGMGPYLYAYILTGNPVFPFYNAIFKSPQYYSAANFSQPTFQQGLSLNILYSTVFEAEKYIEGTVGSAGFQFISLFPRLPCYLGCLLAQ